MNLFEIINGNYPVKFMYVPVVMLYIASNVLIHLFIWKICVGSAIRLLIPQNQLTN